MVADDGATRTWSRPAGTTRSVVDTVRPAACPVTVCTPAAVAVQSLVAQEPLGAIENCVLAVISPRETPELSNASAVYVCVSPAVIVASDGVMAIRSTSPLRTRSDAVPVASPNVPVTVWSPDEAGVQTAPEQEPSGAIVNVVCPVASPSEFP